MTCNVGRLERIARLIAGVMILGLYGALTPPWAVEDALGSLNGDEIQGGAQRRFALLGAEEVHHDV